MHAARSSHVLCDGIVIVALLVSMVAAAGGAEPPTASVPATASAPAVGALPLNLQPTELTLVDGRKVQGQLACEIDDRLVVYSPGLGTLASFRKEFVASYTKGKEVVKVSSPRNLTPEELKLGLDWNGWPDAAPANGPKPDYTTQKWDPPKRLLVWKNLSGQPKTGKVQIAGDTRVDCVLGNGREAGNWLVIGAPLDGGKWDFETDVLLPGVDVGDLYLIEFNRGAAFGTWQGLRFRHVAAENHAWLHSGHGGISIQGNVWIHERGRCQEDSVADSTFVGPFHTFIKNARPPLCEQFRHADGTGAAQKTELGNRGAARTWDNGGYRLSQYIFVKKDQGASVEFLGSFSAGDKFWAFSGHTILGPDSSVHSDTRASEMVYKDAAMHLMDGAVLGKMVSFPYWPSLSVAGVFTAGLPERPLTRDATIILPFKDYSGVMGDEKKPDVCGVLVSPGGRLQVYSAEPTKARLVFRNSGYDKNPDGMSISPSNTDGPRWSSLPRRIDVLFLGDVALDGVLFEDLHMGGIRLKDLAMKDSWKNITFAPSCQSQKPEDNYVVHQKGVPPIGWSEDPSVKNPVRTEGKAPPWTDPDAAGNPKSPNNKTKQ